MSSSVIGPGNYFNSAVDNISAARLDQKTVTIDTGTNLAALATTYPGQLVVSLDTSGGFTANTLMQRNAANNAWISVNPPGPHDHSSMTTGGLFSTVINDNVGQIAYYNYYSPVVNDFLTTLVTGGTVTNVQGAGDWNVKIASSTTANSSAQADLGGISLDWGNPIKFQAKVNEAGGTTGLQGRMGVNIESVGSAANNANKSLGFEFCDSTGTTYQVESGDGTTRSVVNTTQAFAGIHCIRFLYTPALSIIGTVDQTAATTKTSNLPNTGLCDRDKIARFGIQTTNTTQKTLSLYGLVVNGVANDTWFQ